MGYEKPISVIPHGTDFSKFFPMDPLACRKELGVPEDAFIVFNGNRNQPRKRIDLTLKHSLSLPGISLMRDCGSIWAAKTWDGNSFHCSSA
jgi:hypothetical protein